MFQRLRQTIEVFTARKPAAHQVPDIVFVEEQKEEFSKLSKTIGKLMEASLLALIAGTVGYYAELIAPKHTTLSVGTITGLATAAVFWVTNQFIHNLNVKVGLKLRIGERLDPYFGHRLYETYRILRG